MTKNQIKEISKINSSFKNSMIVLEEIRKSEAAKFINMPINFVAKGGVHDSNASLLADTIEFLKDCTDHLDEIESDN